jgi:PKD repeat protein
MNARAILLSALLLAAAPLLPGASADTIPLAEAGPGKTVYVNEPVWLNGSALDDGTITLYEWDFDGDGTFDWRSNQSGNASHVYPAPGVYNPVFRVTDDSGQTGVDRTSVSVRSRNMAPYAEAGEDRAGETGSPVALNGTGFDPDGAIVKYEWDFESDGSWDFGGLTGNVSHIYESPGTYRALLRVTDNGTPPANDTDLCLVTVYAVNIPPSANAGPALAATAGEPVLLSGKGLDADGYIALYEWDFDGEGRWDRASNTTGAAGWTYYVPGTYTARLRVTDNGPVPKSATAWTTVTVVPKNNPPVVLGPSGLSATTGRAVRLTVLVFDADAADSVARVGWDFDGNGAIDYYSAGGNASHIYNASGVYAVKVTAYDTANSSSSWTITVKVSDPPAAPGWYGTILPYVLGALVGLGIGAAIAAPVMARYVTSHWERFYRPTAAERLRMQSELERDTDSGSGFRGVGGDDDAGGKYRDLGT